MLALLAPFAGPLVRGLLFALALAGAAGWGAWKMHQRDQVAYNALTSEFASFKGGVKAIGKAAKEKAEAKEKADKFAKETADEENRRSLATTRATISKLRAAAAKRDSRGGSVSPAPAGSRCPDGAVCFAVAEYQRTLGEFDTGARRLVDEGTALGVDLNTAREWAQRRTP